MKAFWFQAFHDLGVLDEQEHPSSLAFGVSFLRTNILEHIKFLKHLFTCPLPASVNKLNMEGSSLNISHLLPIHQHVKSLHVFWSFN